MSTAKNVSMSSRRRITGQGMTEYIIVVALIAIAAVAAVSYFGEAVQVQFANMGDELMGTAGTRDVASDPDTAAKSLETWKGNQP